MEIKLSILPHQTECLERVSKVFENVHLKSAELFSNPIFDENNPRLKSNIEEIQNSFGSIKIPKELPQAKNYPFGIDVRMETGTGKTYCYTRLMYELNKRYGFHKFIILVPTIPIKEGTMSFIESSYAIQHFADIYPDLRITLSVLNTQKNNKGRKIFPQAIADFARGTLLEKGRISALLMSSGMLLSTATMDYEYDQALFGTYNNPYDTLKATRPIVLLDEPHKFKREGKAYKKLIDKINPLCVIRFGATFPFLPKSTQKDYNNLVFDLGSCEAFNNNLVKGVATQMIEAESLNETKVKLLDIITSPKSCRLRNEKTGKTYDLKIGDSLATISDEFAGITIIAIGKTENEDITKGLNLSNGQILVKGDKIYSGIYGATYQELMMRQAIKNHIAQERENFFRERKIKTLSLFFIDSIYSYRGDNGMGSLRESFQNILKENLEEEMKKFKDSPSKIHQEYISFVESSLKDISATNGGYFSEDNSNTDEYIQKEVHQILKDKQSLLNFKNTNGGWNTRRFIFSKWTLREGWDNPNVFQICKLRSSGSEVSKLQEVGRGLRLPIDEYGNRICDEQFYLTYLVDYCEKDFADSLIQEIKQNEKHTSSSQELQQNKVINKNHESGVVNVRKDKFEELRQLWHKINQKYYLLLGDACEEELYKATLNILKEGIEEDVIACTIEQKTSLEDGNLTIKEAVASHYILDKTLPYGEFLKKTQNATGLSVRIMHKALCEYHKIRAIDRMFFNENSLSNFVRKFKAWFEGAFLKRFSYKALNVDSLETALTDVNGEVREKIIQGTIGIIKDDNLAVPENFLYDKVIFDSSKEKESIVNSSMDEVVVFGKIPRRSVQVPLYFGGTTSPDFMYVIKKNNNVEINFIVETKDVDAQTSLRGTEDLKIQASQKFFETLQKDGIPVVFKAQLQNDDIVNMIHKLSL